MCNLMQSYSGILGTNYIVTWLHKLRGCCSVNFKIILILVLICIEHYYDSSPATYCQLFNLLGLGNSTTVGIANLPRVSEFPNLDQFILLWTLHYLLLATDSGCYLFQCVALFCNHCSIRFLSKSAKTGLWWPMAV